MIQILNKNTVFNLQTGHFPDKTQLIRIDQRALDATQITIKWDYESESELSTLIFITRHLQENSNAEITLEMPYIPNARMDRVNNPDEVFTLKYFAEIINSLHFDQVQVLDPHSDVSKALFNRLSEIDVAPYIEQAINDYKPDVLFMPDEGAHKRYSNLLSLPSTFGIKLRDWRTGEIKDYHLADPEMIKNKRVLIIDDISSRGGTFYYAGQLLHKNDAKSIGLYVTHCEKTIKQGFVLDPNKSYINQVYTADPLWHDTNDEKLNQIKIIR